MSPLHQEKEEKEEINGYQEGCWQYPVLFLLRVGGSILWKHWQHPVPGVVESWWKPSQEHERRMDNECTRMCER
eukprot:1162100-Pelagomonas_calceolata.AAC.17